MRKYAYGKVYNADAYSACTNMPRFGHKGILTEQQIDDVVGAADGSGVAREQVTAMSNCAARSAGAIGNSAVIPAHAGIQRRLSGARP